MKKISRIFLSFLLIATLAFSPITLPQFSTVKTVEAAKVKINKKKKTLYIGQKYQLKVTGTKKKVKWSSSKKAIASVNQKGKVTAKRAGVAVITAKVGKKSYTSKITVKNRITVNTSAITIDEFNKKVSVTVKYVGGGTIYWDTSNDDIAQPSWSKKWNKNTTTLYITSGEENGTATVTLTNSLNNEKVTIDVTVDAPTPEDLLKITLENELPDTFAEYSSSGRTQQLYTLEKFEYDVTYYEYSGEYTVTLRFIGTKTYDENGSGQSQRVPIGWKLYDEDGYVVESGTANSSAVCEGEGFRDAEDLVFDMKAGNYTLKILNTN